MKKLETDEPGVMKSAAQELDMSERSVCRHAGKSGQKRKAKWMDSKYVCESWLKYTGIILEPFDACSFVLSTQDVNFLTGVAFRLAGTVF